MSLKSAADEEFLKTLKIWLGRQTQVLVLIRYSRAAGNKDFEFHTSFAVLQERLRQLPAEGMRYCVPEPSASVARHR
jgi:hypothetical protein